MSGVPYIRFFGDDWLSGTNALSLEERGVLITLVALTSTTGGPVPLDMDRLPRRLGCTKAKTKKLLNALVDQGKITIFDELIHNKKAKKETKTAQEKSEKASEVSKERWAKSQGISNDNNDPILQTDMQENMRSHSPSICQPEPEPEPELLPDGNNPPYPQTDLQALNGASPAATSGKSQSNFDDEFEAVWKAYPRKVGKGNAKKAWTKARKIASKDEIAPGLWSHIKVWNGGTAKDKIPHLATWLNGERWHDDANAAANRSANSDEQLDSLTAPQEDPLGQDFLDSFKPSNQQIDGVLSGAIKKIGKA